MTTPSQGAKVLLLGDSGSGKTFSTATLAECGLAKVCFLWMEPGCYNSIAKYFSLAGKPIPDNFYWATAPLATQSWDDMLGTAKIVNSMSQQGIANWVDGNRSKHDAFMRVLSNLKSFKDARTGKDLGEVDSWGTDTCLVFESLSTLGESVMRLGIGGKPLASQADWQIAMNNIEMFLNKLVSLQCHVVLTSHLDREVDELVGGTKLMPGTLGRKLAPKVPRYFDEVIHCKRDGTKFSWDTGSGETVTKTRLLALEAGQKPTFVPLIAAWHRLAGLGQPTTPPAPPAGAKATS